MVTQLVRVGAYTTTSPGFTLPDDLLGRLRAYSPKSQLGAIVKSCFRHLPTDLAGELLDAISRTLVVESELDVTVIRASGRVERHGVSSRKVITTAGVGFQVDAWQNLVELETMKFHGLGTGTTAEASGDTALVTELTNQYSPDNTRATGSLAENAANIFESVGTNTLDVAATIQEHGLFSQAPTGGGILWDRSLTGTQTLSAADGLQTTYRMTATAGG